MQRKRSLVTSAAFVALWIATISVIYFGGPLWLLVVLGGLGAVLALNDHAYIRSQARSIFRRTEK